MYICDIYHSMLSGIGVNVMLTYIVLCLVAGFHKQRLL